MNKVPIKVVIGGVAALIVAMGIGRFAYTPILPLMEGEQLFTEQGAGYLASANYLGYLIGAILASLLKWPRGRKFYLVIYIAISVVTTILMGLTESIFAWYSLRLISGLSSGIIFVFASSIVIDTLSLYGRMTLTGLLYSGVGLGIFISGIFVPIFNSYFNWHGAWIGIGLVASLIGLIVISFIKEPPKYEVATNKGASNRKNSKSPALKYLLLSYGCEGVGYIISATFLVALVQKIPSLSGIPSISWVIVGLAAAPSCYIWSLIAERCGNLKTLQLAYVIQIVGMILPALLFNALGAIVGSILFGATFMGITTIFMAEVRSYTNGQSSKLIGYFTFVYGIGQMIGPAVAGVLITRTGNYNAALYFASAVLVVGFILLAIVKQKNNKVKLQSVGGFSTLTDCS